MANSEIRQHKEMAMGKDIGYDGCETPFKGNALHGGPEMSKKKHMHDGKRGLKPMSKSADHGDHEMGVPRDSDGD
jgi:hypothetical protein